MEPDRTRERQIVERTTRWPVPTRHDLVLAAVPLAFALALVAGLVSPVSIRSAITVAALAGTAAVVDALFINPPGRNGRREGRRRRVD